MFERGFGDIFLLCIGNALAQEADLYSHNGGLIDPHACFQKIEAAKMAGSFISVLSFANIAWKNIHPP